MPETVESMVERIKTAIELTMVFKEFNGDIDGFLPAMNPAKRDAVYAAETVSSSPVA